MESSIELFLSSQSDAYKVEFMNNPKENLFSMERLPSQFSRLWCPNIDMDIYLLRNEDAQIIYVYF